VRNFSSGWFAGRHRLLPWLSALLLLAGTPAVAHADCYGQVVESCSASADELFGGTGVWCAGIAWIICEVVEPL